MYKALNDGCYVRGLYLEGAGCDNARVKHLKPWRKGSAPALGAGGVSTTLTGFCLKSRVWHAEFKDGCSAKAVFGGAKVYMQTTHVSNSRIGPLKRLSNL